MIKNIIAYSLNNRFVVLLFVAAIIGFGMYSLSNIPIGAVPDVTNNQVQVITTSRDLSTEEVERFLTYPVELEMANLPGVQEIRSISKFGLSVVTIVFDDDMGTYLPRQLIGEKLKAVEDQIPNNFGTPTLGPISTGLGEIYQYILDVKPGYESQYTVTQLRTIQDWIVKRQLSGVPGVVEVNTWGGLLKTYEVAINPIQLQATNISLAEVYEALSNNNSVAGGGYIEKTNETYFIRAEGLVQSIDDIKNIVVKSLDGTPIYVSDIATVGFGSATRFGAITGNGEGEKVLGQVMMLKGADSKKVIDSVIDRVDEIQSSLPEGVFINPFLERSDLIGRTTATITENLIFGFLIVLFVVVFLLGNIRSGLVVASVIPLTLLFALSLMYLFGVDANLMSLGAIDFGIIIDGAVIIVEYIAFSITQNSVKLRGLAADNQKEVIIDLVGEGANKMMHSAVFGQIIIIIVFIPILVLSGIEGKMFRPMALTFCFALLGAMILCFTYVPVMASMFLKSKGNTEPNIATKFIESVKKMYFSILTKALEYKFIILAFAVGLLMLAGILFSCLGGEFVPTLDEGDFVIQPVLKTGMSLAETVKMTTRIEKVVKRFPEVKQVVSRIGAAEVPTDPMSMEESDVIIILIDKTEWTTASSKDELADVLKNALLSEIPGVEIEFTQPIEMRFNELISGARSDLAIKLYGDDLEILYKKAEEIESAISIVEGAADISVEKIDGLPQMSIYYDRAKIARYGVNISQLNDLVAMGFAGRTAGTVFDGESQFDIVVRYDKDYRSDIGHLRNALVDLPSGRQLPLTEFAKIEYTVGPAKISRDDTKRRVVVGVNVRGRDLQTVVDEVRSVINQEVNIPTGYYIQYGGQFENLKNASDRLMIAVPIALILIFILLFFAFQSFREALLIYSAIPLATIGGVFALYIRGMPFSISAGVGFIALFGLAVLNGIVMIEHFKELKMRGMTNINDLIIKGAVDRLRPVLLTATAAGLGFLPMAISTSAGAEIQRPLATVVIGGLLTATLLTLIVLPILYLLFGKVNQSVTTISNVFLVILLFIPFKSDSQQILSLPEIIKMAEENNLDIKSSLLELERQKTMVDATYENGRTEFYYQYDRNNVSDFGGTLHVLGIGHSFKMPSVYRSKKEMQNANVDLHEGNSIYDKYVLNRELTLIYDRLSYQHQLLEIYEEIDSINNIFLMKSIRKYELGESNILEKLSAQQKSDETSILMAEVTWNIEDTYSKLYRITQPVNPFVVKYNSYRTLLLPIVIGIENNPLIVIDRAKINFAQKKTVANYNSSKPELYISLFNGISNFSDIKLYPGIQANVSIALSKKTYNAQKSADMISEKISELRLSANMNVLKRNESFFQHKLRSINNRLINFDSTVLQTSKQLLFSAEAALQNGTMDYFKYLTILDSYSKAKIKRLSMVHDHNQAAISLQYLSSYNTYD